MDDLRTAESVLEGVARELDAAALTGQDAIDVVTVLGPIIRLASGVLAKALKRVEDTAAYTYGNDRSAAELGARLVGVGPGEAKRAIETASKLQALPATDAAVRAGKPSARQADLFASNRLG